MAKYIIAKYNKCYADEFDCEGFGIYTKKDWEKICKKTEAAFEKCNHVEVSFGTNEGLDFSSYDEWFDSFDITEIEEDEANKLIKIFGESFGTGSNMLDVVVYMDGDDIDDGDDEPGEDE